MLARNVQPFHSNPECQNPHIKPEDHFINYKDISITTAGADLLCCDWAASHDFAKAITYYHTEDIDAGIECGTWTELPRHLKATDYTLSISTLHGNEDLSCGMNKFAEYLAA